MATLYKVVCPECGCDQYTTHLYVHLDCPNQPGGGDQDPPPGDDKGGDGNDQPPPEPGIFVWEEAAFNDNPQGDPDGTPVTRPCPGCLFNGQQILLSPTELRCSNHGEPEHVVHTYNI